MLNVRNFRSDVLRLAVWDADTLSEAGDSGATRIQAPENGQSNEQESLPSFLLFERFRAQDDKIGHCARISFDIKRVNCCVKTRPLIPIADAPKNEKYCGLCSEEIPLRHLLRRASNDEHDEGHVRRMPDVATTGVFDDLRLGAELRS